MDKTPIYILMCKKAVELQVLFKSKEGDFYIDDVYRKKGLVDVSNGGWTTYEKKNFKGVWLPRQDQLQGMVLKASIDFWKINHFYHWLEGGDERKEISLKYLINNSSMEQYWLAFVMLENYNKIWTGKDWEEIK